MKMQKRIFTVVLSILASFRPYSLPHLISDKGTSSMGKFPSCLFNRASWGSRRYTWHPIRVQSDQHQEKEHLKEEEGSLKSGSNSNQSSGATKDIALTTMAAYNQVAAENERYHK